MPDNPSMTRGPADAFPRPDPTALTTEQLRRELGNLRELLESKLEAVVVRIDAIDTASALLRSNLEQIVHPDDVTCLRDLTYARIEKSEAVTQEKFVRVETQLIELDKRNAQIKAASDTATAASTTASEKAITTALTAAEKAVITAMAAAEKAVAENNKSFALSFDKSEKKTDESLKNLDNLFKTEIRATNDKVSALSARQDRSDGSSASLVSVASGAVAVMALLIAAYAAIAPKNGAQPQPQPQPQPVVQYVPAPTASPALAPAPVTVPR